MSRKHHKIEATSQTSRGFLCALKVYLFFLTSTAFVDTNAEYGIPISRYTVFLQNCPLEHCSKDLDFFICPLGQHHLRVPTQHHLSVRSTSLPQARTNERGCPKGEMKLRQAANGRMIRDKEKSCFEKPLFGRLFCALR